MITGSKSKKLASAKARRIVEITIIDEGETVLLTATDLSRFVSVSNKKSNQFVVMPSQINRCDKEFACEPYDKTLNPVVNIAITFSRKKTASPPVYLRADKCSVLMSFPKQKEVLLLLRGVKTRIPEALL